MEEALPKAEPVMLAELLPPQPEEAVLELEAAAEALLVAQELVEPEAEGWEEKLVVPVELPCTLTAPRELPLKKARVGATARVRGVRLSPVKRPGMLPPLPSSTAVAAKLSGSTENREIWLAQAAVELSCSKDTPAAL